MKPVIAFALLLAASAVCAGAQSPGGIKLTDVAGVWEYRATVHPADTLVIVSVLVATADRNGWTIKHGNDPSLPLRVTAVGGDSIVIEAGPYPSTLKPGQTVLRNRIIMHYHGDRMAGAFEARYASGDVVSGKADATRRK
jgi:hypothetical protein